MVVANVIARVRLLTVACCIEFSQRRLEKRRQTFVDQWHCAAGQVCIEAPFDEMAQLLDSIVTDGIPQSAVSRKVESAGYIICTSPSRFLIYPHWYVRLRASTCK